MRTQPRVGIVTSHPIQYQTPLFKALAARSDMGVHVFFLSRAGAEPYYDAEFGQTLQWDVDLLSGYPSTIVEPSAHRRPNLDLTTAQQTKNLLAALRRAELDVLWVFSWSDLRVLAAVTAALRHRVPVIYRTDTSTLDETHGARLRVKRVVLRRLFKRVSGFLVIGSENRKFYQRYGVPPERLFDAPYSVDTDFFRTRAVSLCAERRALRARLGLPEHSCVVLCPAKIFDKKRPHDVLRAFHALQSETTHPTTLVFLGDGALRTEVERASAALGLTNVVFPGFRNQSEMPQWYAASDVMVLASAHERWGLVLNEAMYFSLPLVVSSKVGAAQDLVQHGTNGFVFGVGDTTALAAHLKTLVNDPSLRKKMGEASLRHVQSWSLDCTVDGIARCVTQLTHQRIPRPC